MINRRYNLFFWIVVIIILLYAATRILSTSLQTNPGPLVLNEFVASNGTGLVDEDGDYSDWIEIYNSSSSAMNLAGWTLTDDPEKPDKWAFPDISLGQGEYLIIFASGKDRRTTSLGSSLHTNFRLNDQGEFLGLYNLLDNKWGDDISPTYPQQQRDISYGRSADQAGYAYFSQPTPGSPNNKASAWAGIAHPVEFSVERGFYEAPISVELSSPTADETIYYTTDGSDPDPTSGTKYSQPIEIEETTLLRAVAVKPGFLPSSVNTHTYLFLDDILVQPNTPPVGFPPFDYEMDPEIVNHPQYSQTIKEDLKSIPTMSIVTAAENYDIYSRSEERGAAWERPVSVELIYPNGDGPQAGFQINAGLRIQGGWGRNPVMPKHPLRLFFKGQYGATKLEYPLFPDSPVQTFDTLILRAGVNRSYAGKTSGRTVDHKLATYSRDEWLRASQIDMSGTGSHGIFVHLYLNGMYWGLYNVVERPDASFMSAYLGGDKEEWYAMNHQGQLSGPDNKIDRLIREFAAVSNFEPSQRYAAVEPYVDIPQFIDYVILNFYAGNIDWSDSNWYVGLHNPTGKIQFFAWDSEMTWIDGANIFFDEADEGLHPDRINLIGPAFKALMENDTFKMEFADRLYKHLFNDGPLADPNSQVRWLEVNQGLDRAIVGESARWGDARYDAPITRADWLKAYADVLAQMEGNAAKLIRLTRAQGYYPIIDPPGFSQHGGVVTSGYQLNMTAAAGTIYYTTDGSDPRVPATGAVAPAAQKYGSPFVITATTHLKARALADDPASGSGQIWSALNETTFTVVEQDHKLRLTEIMYNPVGGNNFEFLELKNTGDVPVDLANMFFEGINFTFAPNTPPLPPNEFFVLVNNPNAFVSRYPGLTIGGVYNGRLSNAGETIILRDFGGKVVVSVSYDDENSWPISPDGRGDSLVNVNPDGDPDNPKNWRASTNLNGSPGTDDPALSPPN